MWIGHRKEIRKLTFRERIDDYSWSLVLICGHSCTRENFWPLSYVSQTFTRKKFQ